MNLISCDLPRQTVNAFKFKNKARFFLPFAISNQNEIIRAADKRPIKLISSVNDNVQVFPHSAYGCDKKAFGSIWFRRCNWCNSFRFNFCKKLGNVFCICKILFRVNKFYSKWESYSTCKI